MKCILLSKNIFPIVLLNNIISLVLRRKEHVLSGTQPYPCTCSIRYPIASGKDEHVPTLPLVMSFWLKTLFPCLGQACIRKDWEKNVPIDFFFNPEVIYSIMHMNGQNNIP